MQRRQPGAHGVQVAFYGVYFSVVGQKAERMSQFPAWESVGGETLVDQYQSGGQIFFRKVGIEFLQLRRDEKTFVNDSAGGEGAYESAFALFLQDSSQNEKFSLQFAAVAYGIESQKKLPYHRHSGPGHLAYGFGLYGDFAPADYAVTVLPERLFDKRGLVGMLEDHGDSVLPQGRKVRYDSPEEGVGDLKQKPGAVASQRIVAGGAAVSEVLENAET